MADGIVRATTSAGAAGANPAYTQDRMGNLVVPDWKWRLGVDGRLFQVSNATRNTALATGGTSFSDTAPAFLVDFPAGTTGVPLEIVLNQGGTVAGGAITWIITYDNIVRYSSSGTALTINPCRTDAIVTSAAVAYGSTPTAAALIKTNTIAAGLLAQDVTPSVDVFYPTGVYWKADAPVFLVGPASLVIYTFAGTTQPSWFFRIVWAEVPSTSVAAV